MNIKWWGLFERCSWDNVTNVLFSHFWWINALPRIPKNNINWQNLWDKITFVFLQLKPNAQRINTFLQIRTQLIKMLSREGSSFNFWSWTIVRGTFLDIAQSPVARYVSSRVHFFSFLQALPVTEQIGSLLQCVERVSKNCSREKMFPMIYLSWFRKQYPATSTSFQILLSFWWNHLTFQVIWPFSFIPCFIYMFVFCRVFSR